MENNSDEIGLRVYCLDVDISESDMDILVQKVYCDSKKHSGVATITINGYGKDERSLWHIPEVVTFCKKLTDSGLLHLLAPTTHVKEAMPEGYEDSDEFLNTFGSLEIWLLGLGYKLDDLLLTLPMMEEFMETLHKSMGKYKKLCKQVKDIDL